MTTDAAALIQLLCVDEGHIKIGKGVPDGHGTLGVTGRRWAYCTGGLLNAPHDWRETGGIALESIRHSDPTTVLEAR